jgi:redox-sensitive bicupin YhaK (pirin superfamily)
MIQDSVKHTEHRGDTRGKADHGWLVSRHTFSFAGYFDPRRVQFGALRVLNDDVVMPGMGFGTHPHDNMEIISIPLQGALAHKDSTGREEVIRQGEVQIMSAGSGISHSEYNHSRENKVNFLQIWIFPKEKNIKPRYDQRYFDLTQNPGQLITVVSPDDPEALWINQDAWLSMGYFPESTAITYQKRKNDSGIYLFVIEGSVETLATTLHKRDGLAVEGADKIEVQATGGTRILMMEVPMKY